MSQPGVPAVRAPSLVGLGLISAAMLAFEIGLTRVFSVQQFHHFAFIVVSLGLMGIAASGGLMAVLAWKPPLTGLAVGFSIAVAAVYLVLQTLPFDSYSIAWDGRQALVLLLYFLAAGLPFLFAGWCAGRGLVEAGTEAHRPYAVVLLGSALGVPLALAAHRAWGELGVLGFAAALGGLAAAAFAARPAGRWAAFGLSGLLLLGLLASPAGFMLRLSPYKPLVGAQLALDARTALTRWSATTRVDVVESGSVHIFPGLSLNAAGDLPQQAALFIDGDGPLPITALGESDPAAQDLARHMPSRLAYELRPGADVLILDPGAGMPALLALASGARHITLAGDHPLVLNVVAGPYAEFSQYLMDEARLSISPRPSRGALRTEGASYTIVEFALSDPFRPVTSGAFSLTENFSLTVESLADAYAALEAEGLLMLTRWLGTPPGESVRAWATLLAALEEQGVADPGERLIAYRGMRTATLIAGRRAFRADELAATRRFLEANSFDPVYLPDLRPEELNRYNRLPEEVYAALFSALLADPQAAAANYEFRLTPPTDDRPYFFHFFRWRQTPEVLAGLGRTWQPFGGSGYFVLLALLGLVLVLALAVLLLPQLGRRERPAGSTLLYFAALGAGYLLVEIPFIQRFVLLLDRPAAALAATLFAILIASGIGSLLSPRFDLRRSLALLVAVVIVLIWLAPAAIAAALPWPFAARAALAMLLILPPGLLMGIPFAAGLRRLEQGAPGNIAWAWATNGAASGVSGVLAAMVALDGGFRAVLALGALAYALAWWAVPRLARG